MSSPKILLIAQSPRREMLSERLRRFGFELAQSNEVGHVDQILIDAAGLAERECSLLIAELRRLPSEPSVCVLDDSVAARMDVDIHLRNHRSIAALRFRLGLLERHAARQSVSDAMSRVLEEFGVRLPRREPSGGRRLLFLGAPTPRYLALRHALSAHNVALEAVFTQYSAMDALEANAPDGVVADLTADRATALSLGLLIHEGRHISRTPLILFDDAEAVVEDANPDTLFDYASDSLDAAMAPQDTADRLVAILDERACQPIPRPEQLRFPLIENEAPVFSETFLSAYLGIAVPRDRDGLTLLGISLQPVRPGGTELSVKQVAGLLAPLIRDEDLLTHVGDGQFALALTSQTSADAYRIGGRLRAVAETTRFGSEADDAYQLTFKSLTCRDQYTPQELIDGLKQVLAGARQSAA